MFLSYCIWEKIFCLHLSMATKENVYLRSFLLNTVL